MMDEINKKSLFFPNFQLFLVWFLIVIFLLLGSLIKTSFAQRGLGFKGLVPPPDAKIKKSTVTVKDIDLPLLTVKDGDEGSIKVFVGPGFFFRQKDFSLYREQKLVIWGVPMKVEGDSVFVSFKIQDKETKKKLCLRDKKGEPIWWGLTDRFNERRGSKRGK